MGHLWHEVLGNIAGSSTNVGPFQNGLPNAYWSSTDAPAPYGAWLFYIVGGIQSFDDADIALRAAALRPGDVASAVPEPQTWAMLVLGLGAWTVALKWRKVDTWRRPAH